MNSLSGKKRFGLAANPVFYCQSKDSNPCQIFTNPNSDLCQFFIFFSGHKFWVHFNIRPADSQMVPQKIRECREPKRVAFTFIAGDWSGLFAGCSGAKSYFIKKVSI